MVEVAKNGKYLYSSRSSVPNVFFGSNGCCIGVHACIRVSILKHTLYKMNIYFALFLGADQD